jgi:uncharacterized protein
MSKENLLPQKVDAIRFADNAIHMQGNMLVKNMERLAPSLNSDLGEVSVDVKFGVDEQDVRFIRGQYSTRLMLKCQRCMEPFEYSISGDILAGIVHTEEEAGQLPKDYNSVIVKEGMLVLQEVIEDEIIVSLPVVPMHNSVNCKVKLPFSIDPAHVDEAEKENPFKVVELLRSKRNLDK